MQLTSTPAPPAGAAERRQQPRIEIIDEVQGRMEATQRPTRVLDVSLSGFGIEVRRAFEVGSVHRFRFTTHDGRSDVLSATTVHCDRRLTRDGSDLFLVGFRFAAAATDRGSSADLIARIHAATSFDIS